MKLKQNQIFANFKLNIILFTSVILIILLSFVYFRDSSVYISHDDYEKLLNNSLIQKAHIDDGVVYLTYDGKKYSVLLDSIDPKELYKKTIVTKAGDNFFSIMILSLSIFLIIFCIFIYFLESLNLKRQNSRISSMQKDLANNASLKDELSPVISNLKFDDVAGISEVKDELMEVVDFLKNPLKYRSYGIKLPKGVLMVGPPGVGKTLIAKAVAGEAGVPFFYQSGSGFAEIYVGVGAKRVRELFSKAKSCAPSIIFIDEIDAVGKSRGEGRNDEREATLNQLLTEMDGFDDNSGVIVIAATNKIEVMDEALLRAGRFDRRIFVSLPNLKDRFEILKIYLQDKKHNVKIENVAKICVGFNGAGLATLVNEAAINALRRDSKVIEFKDFESVKNKVLLGNTKNKILSESEKEIQAFYQASKAFCANFYKVDFEKISLFEDRFIQKDEEIISKTEILNKIKVFLAGNAALKTFKNDTYTNASKDLKEAINLANKMVFEYGMSEGLLANKTDVEFILNKAYADVSEVIKSQAELILRISKYLFINEEIDMQILEKLLKIQKEENV